MREIIWHLIGAWFVLIAIGGAWFQGFAHGKSIGEILGADRMRKILLPHSRVVDYGEQ